ncbi:MAG: hypothetical protein MUF34_01445 [Polyangiaceae bacterium]|nr:hypothetical protein [Polyangiaceae bacterium]
MSERPYRSAPSPLAPILRGRLAGLALLAFAPLGCRGCDKDRHPFVPYTFEGGAGAPAAPSASGRNAAVAPSASGSGVVGATFPRVVAVAAPAGATSWSLGGMALSASSGRIFIAGLALAQPPGQPPAVAAFVGDGGSMAGEIILYRAEPGGAAASQVTLARLPAWMGASGAGCNHVVALSQIGPTMLWADVTLRCERGEAAASNRWLAALSTTNPNPLRFELRAASPAEGDRALFEADAADRDGDGTDDLVVQVTLEGNTAAGAGRSVAPLRFLDRPSGMARDTSEPEKAMRAAATELMNHATRKANAAETRANALYHRKLYAYLCSEGGAPGVAFGDGTPVRCATSAPLADLLYAEGRAALALGDVPRAFAAQARLAQDVPKTHRGIDLDKALASATTSTSAKAQTLRAQPLAWSVALPLAFDAAGQLLVLTAGGVISVDPKTGDETPSPTPAWTPAAELVGDLRLTRVSDPCQASSLQLHVTSASASTRSVATPVPGGSAPVCASGASLPLWLLDRGADGLVVLAQGEAVALSADGERVKSAPWPSSPGGRGTIRSPDGGWSALAAGERVLVRGSGGKPQLWRSEPRFLLAGCTVSNGGAAVACMLDKGAVLLTP